MRLLLFLCLIGPLACAGVVPHGLPADYPLSDQATVRVNATPVPVLAHTALYDYCHFSADGPLEVTVTASETIRSWSISPLALNLPAAPAPQPETPSAGPTSPEQHTDVVPPVVRTVTVGTTAALLRPGGTPRAPPTTVRPLSRRRRMTIWRRWWWI